MHGILGVTSGTTTPCCKDMMSKCHPEDRELLRNACNLVRLSKTRSFTFRTVSDQGELREVRAQAECFFDEKKQPVRCVTAFVSTPMRRGNRGGMDPDQEPRLLHPGQLQVLEKEHARVARDLHDQVGQALTGAKLDLAWIARKYGGESPPWMPMMMDAMETIDSGMATVREISSVLRSLTADTVDWTAPIRWHAGEFSKRTGIPCDIDMPDIDVPLSREKRKAILRVFHEAITNSARHAHASHVCISLVKEQTDVVLKVRDNGVGVRQDKIQSDESLGFLGMRERAAAIGAVLSVQSAPNMGTTVSLRVPLKETSAGVDRG